jgi:hypothetical protein
MRGKSVYAYAEPHSLLNTIVLVELGMGRFAPSVDPPWNGSGGRQAGCVGFVSFFGRLGAGMLDKPVAADPIWNLSACKRLRCGATCVGRGSSTES